jgi:hypothetical protein
MIMIIIIIIIIIYLNRAGSSNNGIKNLYKKLNKISSTNSNIYLICINKIVHNFHLIFSNIFTHHLAEIYVFLILHLIH